ncbi:MAG: DUF3783 domain-containing protein [Eubacteriales bacterium]|nr:DUF3783 domain-containing protein [Eubacteriales bacterium]MDD4324685.1 DUF3783 domain-containing protein [Eubacteriales bacterium]
MKKEYILAYGLEGELLQSLTTVTRKNNVGLVLTGDEELDLLVEDLLLVDGASFPELNAPSRSYELGLEHLLFVNFSQESLMSFIDKLKAEGISFPYKAALTENNRKWLLRDLIEANRKEHLFVQLYQGSKNALKLAVEVYFESKDAPLLDAMDKLQQQVEIVEKHGEMSAEEEGELFENLRLRYNDLAARLNELLSK